MMRNASHANLNHMGTLRVGRRHTLRSYGAQHDHGISYTLYLMTFAIDSVGDIFGSVFMLAAGVLACRNVLLPRWQPDHHPRTRPERGPSP